MKVQTILVLMIISLINFTIGIQAREKVVIDHTNWNPADANLDKLDLVRTLKIMFGHQSVGTNIVDGLTLLSEASSTRYGLNIKYKPTQLASAAFGHWKNGENQDPHGKISAFDSKMRSQAGDGKIWASSLDIAYFKFCYVDLNATSINIDDLFENYRVTMKRLIDDFPNCKIVQVTLPLSALIYGSDKERNQRRHEFNEKIRSFSDTTGGYLFDIADIEAHDENGVHQTFEFEGKLYPMMWFDANDPQNNGWSNYGGHLNNKGKEHVALAMWSLWAALVEQSMIDIKKSDIKSAILLKNYPNPFNPATTIEYGVPNSQHIKIEVFNMLGNHVKTLVDQFQNEGLHSISFCGENLASGIYLYRVQAQNFQQTNKMTLLK
jgi:hypothetical protein